MKRFSFACFASLLVLFSCFAPSLQDAVTVSIKGVTTIARTDDNFVCFTADYWPKEKCNYGMCPWAQSSILHMDLDNPILYKALKEFNSVRIRLSGSLVDQVYFKVGRDAARCHDFKLDKDGRFGFTDGCLSMERWDNLNHFFNKTGSIVTMGLNALNGREKVGKDLYVGDWDPTNARDFINYTVSKGYKIESWELGNELSGWGVSGRVLGTQYGKDTVVLKKILTELHELYQKPVPKLISPGGFFDAKWFADMFAASGPGVIDIASHHIYNLGPGGDPNLIKKVQDPYFLSRTAQTYSDVERVVQNYGPWSKAMVGESGGAYNSGGKLQSSFVDGFWFLDTLGMTSAFNHWAFCRQSLIGGNYAVLDTDTYIPNPDYYGALLWHRLMGPGVLQTTHNGSPFLRAYSHCSKHKPGVTLLLINLSNNTGFDITVASDLNLYPSGSAGSDVSEEVKGQREEYHLTAPNGNLKSRVMLLNGVPLKLTKDGDIPAMYPNVADAAAPLHIAPSSIAFIRLRDYRAPACA